MQTARSNAASPTESSSPFGGFRRFRRRELEMDVVLQDAGGWEIPVESVDVSPGGMFVRSEFLFEPGARHVLIFRAPNGQFLFRLRARVVRVEDEDEPPGMAYEFIGVEPETERRLRALAAPRPDATELHRNGTSEG